MRLDRYVFPAVFEPAEGSYYVVTFPDLPGIVTQGSDIGDALAMARDALELHLYCMEEDGDDIPEPTTPQRVAVAPPSFVTLVDVWMPPVRDEMANRSVKKTLTIPKWLDDLADQHEVNYSRVLQEALKDYLVVRDRPRETKPRG